MSRSTPSVLALLGLVAVAGYQNRNRISQMLSDAQRGGSGPGASAPGIAQGGGFLSEVSQLFQGGTGGTTVSGALGDLIERFKSAGRGAAAESWVSHQPNAAVGIADLEAALGPDTLDELTEKTGLSKTELLTRLSSALPEVVNQLTPEGRIPTAEESRGLI